MKEEKKTDALFDKMALAVAAYIEAMGGSAAVLGGVSIQDMRGLKYRICIDVDGKMPTKTNL